MVIFLCLQGAWDKNVNTSQNCDVIYFIPLLYGWMLPNEIEQLLCIRCVPVTDTIYLYHYVQTVLPSGSPNTYYIETTLCQPCLTEPVVQYRFTMFHVGLFCFIFTHRSCFFLGKCSQTFFCLLVNTGSVATSIISMSNLY